MKVTAPDELQGRLIACAQRARLVAETLAAFAHTERQRPTVDSLTALGAVSDELADELEAIEAKYVEEGNQPTGGAK